MLLRWCLYRFSIINVTYYQLCGRHLFEFREDISHITLDTTTIVEGSSPNREAFVISSHLTCSCLYRALMHKSNNNVESYIYNQTRIFACTTKQKCLKFQRTHQIYQPHKNVLTISQTEYFSTVSTSVHSFTDMIRNCFAGAGAITLCFSVSKAGVDDKENGLLSKHKKKVNKSWQFLGVYCI